MSTWMKTGAAAAYLSAQTGQDIDRQTIWRMARSGAITARRKLGEGKLRPWLVLSTEIERLADEGRTPTAPGDEAA